MQITWFPNSVSVPSSSLFSIRLFLKRFFLPDNEWITQKPMGFADCRVEENIELVIAITFTILWIKDSSFRDFDFSFKSSNCAKIYLIKRSFYPFAWDTYYYSIVGSGFCPSIENPSWEWTMKALFYLAIYCKTDLADQEPTYL